MSDSALTAFAGKVIFQNGERTFNLEDVIDAALFRGDLQPLWALFLRIIAAESQAETDDLEIDDAAVDAAAEQFRYRLDLITAEETERWLELRGLSLEDFSDYFVRIHWVDFVTTKEPTPTPYLAAPASLRQTFARGLILSGESAPLAENLANRIAQAAIKDSLKLENNAWRQHFLTIHQLTETNLAAWLKALDRDEAWLDEMIDLEANYQAVRSELLTPQARAREIGSLRLPLTGFDVETVEFDTEDAAREGALCVREDGMSMAEVAEEGRYAYRREKMYFEDLPEDLQGRFLSANSGDLLAPIARGEGFHLWRILDKTEPDPQDTVVRERADNRILVRHFAELNAKHIRWPQFAVAESPDG